MSNAAENLTELMTVEQFLQGRGDGSGRIAELADGVIRLQDPANDTHNTIFGHLGRHIGNHLTANRPQCRVVPTAGNRPQLCKKRNWGVPEIAVTCTPNRKDVRATEGAKLIVEVLSRFNRKDTWENVPLDASVPTVLELLLVDSEKVEAHLLRGQPDGSWPDDPAVLGSGAAIEFALIAMPLPLAVAYDGT